MNLETPADSTMHQVLTQAKVIAVVGHSNRADRLCYHFCQIIRTPKNINDVDRFWDCLQIRIAEVSVNFLNGWVDWINAIADLAQKMSNLIARAIAAQAKTVWAQLGIADPIAAETAQEAGLTVIMDACIKVEYLRLGL